MNKRIDVSAYKTVLPYASELFGVYQPLLGWKSKRSIKRVQNGVRADRSKLLSQVAYQLVAKSTLSIDDAGEVVGVAAISPGEPMGAVRSFQSAVLDAVARQLPPLERYHDSVWQEVLAPARLQALLQNEVAPQALAAFHDGQRTNGDQRVAVRARIRPSRQALQATLDHESMVAGTLATLASAKLHADLKSMFYDAAVGVADLPTKLRLADPFETFDPTKDLGRVALSPVGIVHLFRQYFFEFDTFLGSPVGHVWMSPGSSVELIEISTRRTLTEKTVEQSTESVVKSESSTTAQDDISDAVKESNRDDVKFGANVTAHESGIFMGSTQSASFDMATTQETAREQAHKQMRQQTEKLSTEIRKNYKSTFKTVTETTDTLSKRYVLENKTDKLINYELRRKMRQIGVQVQDVGTYLCWQSYVDEPGKQLGVSKLMHIAKTPDVDNIPHPEKIEYPKPFTKPYAISIEFVQNSPDQGRPGRGLPTRQRGRYGHQRRRPRNDRGGLRAEGDVRSGGLSPHPSRLRYGGRRRSPVDPGSQAGPRQPSGNLHGASRLHQLQGAITGPRQSDAALDAHGRPQEDRQRE